MVSNRVHKVRYRYGISSQQKEQMWLDQNKACAVCGKGLALWGKKGAHIDHAHHTGQIRDLLCGGCNARVAIIEGLLYRGEIPDPYPLEDLGEFMSEEEMDRPWVQAVVSYLERFEESADTAQEWSDETSLALMQASTN